MIGNDIVDLNLAERQSNWQRPGFLEKQFTIKEQKSIFSEVDSFVQVWLFWSMKEAAYKCFTQQVEKRFFAPQKFECTLFSEDQGVVVFNGQQFYTRTIFGKDYLFTIAQGQREEETVFSAMSLPTTIDQDIKEKLQNELGISAAEITQQKTSIGAPLYYHKEKLITQSCSISHHGNYGAYAFTLENEFKKRVVSSV